MMSGVDTNACGGRLSIPVTYAPQTHGSGGQVVTPIGSIRRLHPDLDALIAPDAQVSDSPAGSSLLKDRCRGRTRSLGEVGAGDCPISDCHRRFGRRWSSSAVPTSWSASRATGTRRPSATWCEPPRPVLCSTSRTSARCWSTRTPGRLTAPVSVVVDTEPPDYVERISAGPAAQQAAAPEPHVPRDRRCGRQGCGSPYDLPGRRCPGRSRRW